MPTVVNGPAYYMQQYGDQSIACNQYALGKLGVDQTNCSLKIEDYVISCAPFQLGFKRSIFLAYLSKQELTFFNRYINGFVGLSIAFASGRKSGESLKFFIRCNLTTLGQMKGRENVGLFVVDYKNTLDELTVLLGAYLENQKHLHAQYEKYGDTTIKITADVAKAMGYNMYCTITEPTMGEKRIQIFSLSSKTIEHLEAAGAPVRNLGSPAAYQLYFKKFRISAAGTITEAVKLPQGIVKTTAKLAFSPELVEIIDDYYVLCNNSSQEPGKHS
ncbi:MAG: hypothetical protein LBQ88_22575 [Treponema sp.]|jgi:hypothetical protein|nr:hypothetical protein [Treponema sp.]